VKRANPAQENDVVVAGRLLGAYGVKGWVKLTSFTQPAENLLDYSPWLIEAGAGWKPLETLAARVHGQGFVALFAGIRDRESAHALKGRLLGVPASCLPAPDENEYYWRDLTGAAVYDTSGARLGKVVEIMATGANDVLVVELDHSQRRELIPFSRHFVPEVDLAEKRMTVNWELDADREEEPS
jgi:16S rRNA processing protein RimM